MIEIPPTLVRQLERRGYTELRRLPEINRLCDQSTCVLTAESGGPVVVDARQTPDGEWIVIDYGPGIAFREGPLGRLADEISRRAALGTATATDVAAIGEITEVWLSAYRTNPHGEQRSPAEVDARITEEMNTLRAELALLSDLRARHARHVAAGEATSGPRPAGAQGRAAAALGMSPSTLSRLLSEGERRHMKWTERARDLDPEDSQD